MLKREDFYDILPRTLNNYADFLGLNRGSVTVLEKDKEACIYVNERLNAIFSTKPSKEVRDFLRTEYTVGGSVLRKTLVKAYLTASMTWVKGMSQKGLSIETNIPLNDILIYPCNKKIRLFDFASGNVHTVLKAGFPDTYIKRETEFRKRISAPFIPQLLFDGEGCYTERIICNGKPLARIQDASFVEKKKEESLSLLHTLTKQEEQMPVKEYLLRMKADCLTSLSAKEGFLRLDIVNALFDKLIDGVQDCDIALVTSHGDFQPGNIWIDAEGKVVIIDWETVKLRSPFYDYAALYCQLRNRDSLQGLCNRVKSNQHLSTRKGFGVNTILNVILAEELDYQTEELLSFPAAMGMEYYNNFINEISSLFL